MPTGSTNSAAELHFACACGQVAGVLFDVGPGKGDHIVCHCRDCQNFTRYLGAADRVLQSHGGTDLYQGRCAKMRLSQGADRLACLHLTDAPTLRWYASCCRTPMFNTYANGRVPYLTAVLANFDPDQANAALGPAIGHLFLPDDLGDVPGMPRMAMATLMRRFFGRLVRDLVSGDRRRSPLFDPKTLAPISVPHRLTMAERDNLSKLAADAASPL
jgi:hypothetical protein